jgi:hypothetical protein
MPHDVAVLAALALFDPDHHPLLSAAPEEFTHLLARWRARRAPHHLLDGEAVRKRGASSATLLPLAAVENGAACGAEIASVMGHAGGDALNVRDVLVAKSLRIGFAGTALLLRPLLLRLPLCGGGYRKRQRESKQCRSAQRWCSHLDPLRFAL